MGFESAQASLLYDEHLLGVLTKTVLLGALVTHLPYGIEFPIKTCDLKRENLDRNASDELGCQHRQGLGILEW